MKTTRIISTEYRANRPSVFLFVDGKYYGCQVYPAGRNYPQDVKYWFTATCSDSDRYFSLKEVEITEVQLSALAEMHEKLLDLHEKLLDYPQWVKGVDQTEENNRITEHNKAFDKEIYRLKEESRKLILNL